MIHPEMAGVKKANIRSEISKKFKAAEDRIAVFGLKPKFGGGRSSGFVTVYDDIDARKKYDTKANLFRVGILVLLIVCSRFTKAQRYALSWRVCNLVFLSLIYECKF